MCPSALEFRPLSREHNDALVALFRASPIVADFTICFDRHPDFFRFPDSVFDSYTYRGIFRGERMIGCVMYAQLTGWLGPDWLVTLVSFTAFLLFAAWFVGRVRK